MLLDVLGHEARVVYDPLVALEQLRRGVAADAVLVDIGLPAMDGYEFARLLRAEPTLADLLLVAMTGYAGEEDRSRAREAGFDHHLVKPVDIERLEGIVARVRPGEAHRAALR